MKLEKMKLVYEIIGGDILNVSKNENYLYPLKVGINRILIFEEKETISFEIDRKPEELICETYKCPHRGCITISSVYHKITIKGKDYVLAQSVCSHFENAIKIFGLSLIKNGNIKKAEAKVGLFIGKRAETYFRKLRGLK